MRNLNEVVGTEIKRIINGNKDHGWGQADSLVVIEEIVCADVENHIEAKKDPTKYVFTDEAKSLVNDFVNPSAARQKLESAGLLNKNTKSERKKALWANLAK